MSNEWGKEEWSIAGIGAIIGVIVNFFITAPLIGWFEGFLVFTMPTWVKYVLYYLVIAQFGGGLVQAHMDATITKTQYAEAKNGER